jgi:hypothetical protein
MALLFLPATAKGHNKVKGQKKDKKVCPSSVAAMSITLPSKRNTRRIYLHTDTYINTRKA